MSSNAENHQEAAYERVCESYHAVDDFRMKLLGLLPIATGAGVFLLLNSNADLLGPGQRVAQQRETLEVFLRAIGTIGVVFTLGLFAYELFGIKKCHYLIEAGARLEVALGVRGQFTSRPRALLGFVNEPLATALIYPASMAAWAFLAVAYSSDALRWALPAAVFLLGMAVTMAVATGIKRSAEASFRAEILSHIGESDRATIDDVATALGVDPVRARSAVDELIAQKVLEADEGTFRRLGDRARDSTAA
jgi:hypothetical protein